MTERTVTVQARQPGGGVAPVSRTLYSTRWGPVFNIAQGFLLPWSATTAFALGDANRDNFRAFNHFFAMDRASLGAPSAADPAPLRGAALGEQ